MRRPGAGPEHRYGDCDGDDRHHRAAACAVGVTEPGPVEDGPRKRTPPIPSRCRVAAVDAPDASTPGLHTVSCTATDNVGNVSHQSASYVVGFGVTKLTPPAKTQFGATIRSSSN